MKSIASKESANGKIESFFFFTFFLCAAGQRKLRSWWQRRESAAQSGAVSQWFERERESPDGGYDDFLLNLLIGQGETRAEGK